MTFGTMLKSQIGKLILLLCIYLISVVMMIIMAKKGQTVGLIIFLIIPPVMTVLMLYWHYKYRKIYFRDLNNLLENKTSDLDPLPIRQLIHSSPYIDDMGYYPVVVSLTDYIIRQLSNSSYENNRFAYIEEWTHDIKNPLSAIRMLCENNYSDFSTKILVETDKADNCVEKILSVSHYLSDNDYFNMKTVSLKKAVNAAVIRNKTQMILSKIHLNIHDVDVEVYTDLRLLESILSQMIQNSINYRRLTDPEIEIYTERLDGLLCLTIYDNGVGIKPDELGRIFEEGFIGTNESNNSNASGIGLYISARIAKKIGLLIHAESKYGEYTKMRICFPSAFQDE